MTFFVLALIVFIVWLVIDIVLKRKANARARKTVQQVVQSRPDIWTSPTVTETHYDRPKPIKAAAPRYVTPSRKEGGSATKPTTSKPKYPRSSDSDFDSSTYVESTSWADTTYTDCSSSDSGGGYSSSD